MDRDAVDNPQLWSITPDVIACWIVLLALDDRVDAAGGGMVYDGGDHPARVAVQNRQTAGGIRRGDRVGSAGWSNRRTSRRSHSTLFGSSAGFGLGGSLRFGTMMRA